MRTFLISIFTLLPVFNMGNLVAQQMTISGKLSGFQNGEKIALYDPDIMETLDSTYLKNGVFKLKNPIGDTPKTVFITVNDELSFLPFIAGENIEISGDKKDFKYGLTIQGSKFQKEKEVFTKQTLKYDIERNLLLDSLDATKGVTSEAGKALRKSQKKRIDEIDTILDSISIKYIKQNYNSQYALAHLSYYYDLFSKKEIQDLYDKLDVKHKEGFYGKRIKIYLDVGKTLEAGDIYHDFEAKGQDGKMHNLSEIKNKYILLDINETYCGPCIMSVGELKKIAAEYKESLKVVSYCADKPEDIWKKGLRRDKIDWLSLWDGKGPKGATAMKYGSDGFPTFVLIGKDGIIIEIIKGYEKGILENMLKENIKL